MRGKMAGWKLTNFNCAQGRCHWDCGMGSPRSGRMGSIGVFSATSASSDMDFTQSRKGLKGDSFLRQGWPQKAPKIICSGADHNRAPIGADEAATSRRVLRVFRGQWLNPIAGGFLNPNAPLTTLTLEPYPPCRYFTFPCIF